MPMIFIHPTFVGTSVRRVLNVTISGTFYPPDRTCTDMDLTLACGSSASRARATVDNRSGSWTALLPTDCKCGTDLVTVVASSASTGLSAGLSGPIVCYVDWNKRSLVDRIAERWIHPRWTLRPRQFLAPANLGSCPKCMAISVALFVLAVLILATGAIANWPLLVWTGLPATAAFGSLVAIHGFYFVKRMRPRAQQPIRRSCCGG